MTAAERVARGAALLDEQRPGWAAEIDLSLLDLYDGCRCVLGQLWDRQTADSPRRRNNKPYALAVHDLGLVRDDANECAEYGFTVMPGESPAALSAELDELWIAEIRRRLDTT